MTLIRDLNPATGELIAEIPATTEDQLIAAVTRARAAAVPWAATPIDRRVELIEQAAAGLERRADELADLVTREMGKPREDALREVKGYVKHMPELAAEVRAAVLPEEFDGDTTLVREPHGVVAAIAPWNFPVGMPLSILVPALVTGNTVVFKPSEMVPLVGALIADVLLEVLPGDVLHLVQGAGDVGARLVESDVDMIGFVGSRETGMRIMESASRSLKRLVLELGGKDPMVVFADADLEEAAECAARHSLRNAGQVCCSVERVYVADDIAAEFERRVVEKAREWTHGDGFEEGVRMGPMVSEEQREKVVRQVDDAVAHGARLLLGGSPAEGAGFFYPATVLADVGRDLVISQQETFGPVVAITPFSGDEFDGIALANDTPFGLGASVYTADEERGMRVARAIKAGQVGVNRYLGGATGTPWVGARQSGFGFLGGVDGHRQFTTPKSISRAKAKVPEEV